MDWPPPKQGKLRKTLIAVYRDIRPLRRFIRDNFDHDLSGISGANVEDWAADVIEDAVAKGWIDELYQIFCQENLANNQISKLQELIGDVLVKKDNISEEQTISNSAKDYFDQRICLESEQPVGDELLFQLPAQYADLNFESFLAPPLSYEADVGKLKRGLQLANAVCRIVFEDRPTTGTGVLIAPDLVLTNYHVLSREKLEGRSPLIEKAQTLICEFGWISDDSQSPIQPDSFSLDVANPVLAFSLPSELDYVLLRLDSAVKQCQYLHPVSISQQSIDLKPKEALNILQHPAGETMQISLSASGVVGMDQARHRLWYVNRTHNGSSGAPCFNDNWECIALHHASMSRGFGSIREGILLSSIWTEIQPFLDEV